LTIPRDNAKETAKKRGQARQEYGNECSQKYAAESPAVRAPTDGIWLYLAFRTVADSCGVAGNDAGQPVAPVVEG
jgi:hypothetical protein